MSSAVAEFCFARLARRKTCNKIITILTVTCGVIRSAGQAAAQKDDTNEENVFPANPQRPSFTTDTSVAVPGTLEIELGGSATADSWRLPTSIRFTPDVENWMRGTELFLSFYSFAVSRDSTRFGDRMFIGARRKLLDDGRGFSLAFAALADLPLSGKDPTELGGAVLAVRGIGPHTLVGNVLVSVPTGFSELDPPTTTTWAAGYSLALGREGKLGIFAELLQELPRGEDSTISLMQGISFRLRPNIVLDLAVQEDDVSSTGGLDIRVHAGLTVNMGLVRGWFR